MLEVAPQTAFDKMCGRSDRQVMLSKPVGSLRIHMRQQLTETGLPRSAKVTLSIPSNGRPIYFTGTLAREVRPGWVTLEIPPLEAWEESLSWISRDQRERHGVPRILSDAAAS